MTGRVPALAVAGAVLLAAASGEARALQLTRCLDGVPDLVDAPGDVASALRVSVARNRTVEADERTVAFALALAPTLGSPLRFDEVVNWSEERVETCLVERSTDLDRGEVLRALALGAHVPHGSLLSLAGSSRTLVTFHVEAERRVHIDAVAAKAALAIHVSGGHARLEDVMTVQERAEIERIAERVVDLDAEEALLAVVLAGFRGSHGKGLASRPGSPGRGPRVTGRAVRWTPAGRPPSSPAADHILAARPAPSPCFESRTRRILRPPPSVRRARLPRAPGRSDISQAANRIAEIPSPFAGGTSPSTRF